MYYTSVLRMDLPALLSHRPCQPRARGSWPWSASAAKCEARCTTRWSTEKQAGFVAAPPPPPPIRGIRHQNRRQTRTPSCCAMIPRRCRPPPPPRDRRKWSSRIRRAHATPQTCCFGCFEHQTSPHRARGASTRTDRQAKRGRRRAEQTWGSRPSSARG